MAIETWHPTPEERATIREALNLASARAWFPAELETVLKLRDILADPTGDMEIWYDAPLVTPEQLARIHAEQGANLKTSTATTEYMVARHTPTGGVFVLRVSHGGEQNGDVTLLTGSRGPYRESVSPELLMDFRGAYNESAEHLEWLADEEANFQRLDLPF